VIRTPDGVAIGVDVGGTKILGLALDHEQKILARALVSTPHPAAPDGGVALAGSIAELVGELDDLVGAGAPVGIGLPGLVRDGSTLVFAPNLQSAQGADFASLLAGPLGGRPVTASNDADFAVIAEHRAGAGRGHDDVVMITLGTGIGGGIVVGGALVRGGGFAGEVGHMVLDVNGPPCPCGARGCWERFASGSGLGRIAREAALAGRLTALVALLGGDPEAVRGEDVTAAAAVGDPESLLILEEVGWWLARGIANLVCVLDPTCVVLGGGMAEAADLLLVPAQHHLGGLLEAPTRRPAVTLVGARFGADAGAVGAAIAARELM
jgi:glucokinase